MALTSLQAVLERAGGPLAVRNARRLIASGQLAVERNRQLIQASRELIATERRLMAQWGARRAGVRALLARPRRSPHVGLLISPKPPVGLPGTAAAVSFEPPKAA